MFIINLSCFIFPGLLNTSSSESQKLTPIVVSHVVTSEVAVEKLSTLTINDPSDDVMTFTPTTVTSQEPDAAAATVDSDASDANSAGSEDASPRDNDVIHTEEMAELV